MPDPGSHAVKIAEAAASAWWKAHGGSMDAIPLGVVAALALMTQADPAGPDPAKLILGADRDEIADLLRHIWTLFAITRPELSIRTGPFAAWLDDPASAQLDGAHTTAHAVVKAGQLTLTGDRDLAREVDLLGHVYQELRNPKAKKAHGEIFTPAVLATAMARMTLAGAEPGQSICDPFAGTGGLLRAAAQELRAQGVDPRSMHWHAADIDPVLVAWPSTCTYGISARTSWWAARTSWPRATGRTVPSPSSTPRSNSTTHASWSPASWRLTACSPPLQRPPGELDISQTSATSSLSQTSRHTARAAPRGPIHSSGPEPSWPASRRPPGRPRARAVRPGPGHPLMPVAAPSNTHPARPSSRSGVFACPRKPWNG